MQPEARKVLVVDDSALILSMMRDTLGLVPSLAVRTVDNARDAIDLLVKETDYQLVFLDVEMPGMTGLEALDELRRRGFDTERVVVCSADSSPELQTELANRHAGHFLPKPLEPRELFRLVKSRWGIGVPLPQKSPAEGYALLGLGASGLQNFNGNLDLYETSLRRFLDEYRQWLGESELGSAFSDMKDYRFFLHTLKGVSSYIGATKIVEQVTALQDSIRQGLTGRDLAETERGLLSELRRILQEISERFPPTSAAASAPSTSIGDRRVELLRQTLELVTRSDAEALDFIGELDQQTFSDETRLLFQTARRFVLDYEFERAAEPLRALIYAINQGHGHG